LKIRSLTFLALAVSLLGLPAATFAHHGTANYDTEHSISVKGTVTDFQFVNPHVLIYMTAKDAGGKTTSWQGELTSPNRLARAGWKKDTIKNGDTITISGFPAKSGSPEVWIQKVITADGTPLDTSGGS
jgi:hypothetical protein